MHADTSDLGRGQLGQMECSPRTFSYWPQFPFVGQENRLTPSRARLQSTQVLGTGQKPFPGPGVSLGGCWGEGQPRTACLPAPWWHWSPPGAASHRGSPAALWGRSAAARSQWRGRRTWRTWWSWWWRPGSSRLVGLPRRGGRAWRMCVHAFMCVCTHVCGSQRQNSVSGRGYVCTSNCYGCVCTFPSKGMCMYTFEMMCIH